MCDKSCVTSNMPAFTIADWSRANRAASLAERHSQRGPGKVD
jgi:hypothetical protein